MSVWSVEAPRLKDILFYLGVGTLFTHELDAMPNHEWRVLPGLSALPDETGMVAFVLAHVPLFALVIGTIASLDPRIRRNARIAVAAFLVVHAVLHTLFRGHVAYDFAGWLSNSLIYGAALAGAVFLFLELRPGGARR